MAGSRTASPQAPTSAADRPAWWRTVLGEYPTGVAIVTSVDPQRRPVGMVVGSFTAVSDTPPLIGFLPSTGSSTWQQVRTCGRFRVSVLGSQHEQLCRDFARDPQSRFTSGTWRYDDDGIPVLADALTWFDATVATTTDTGDHTFVVGSVTDFGVGDGAAGLPLLYLKGSYGSFAVPRLEFDLHEFGGHLRQAEQLRGVLTTLADDLRVECLLTTVVRDSVIVLAATDGATSDAPQGPAVPSDRLGSLIGANFPFAAPMAPVFAAWSTADRVTVWTENARHLLGSVDRPLLADLLDRVRERGYSVSVGPAMADHFDAVISHPRTNRAHLATLWAAIQQDYRNLITDPQWPAHVSSIQVPVFGDDGTARLELVVSGFAPCSPATFDAIVARALAASADLTGLIARPTTDVDTLPRGPRP